MANSLPDFTKIAQPFANSGDRNTIPQTATGTNNASFQEGFPSITSTPLTDGGMPPERADFNALGYAATSTLAYLQQGGVFTFDETISSIIGGYPQGAILDYIVDNKVYRLISLINNNTYNFNSDSSYIGEYWDYVNQSAQIDLANVTANIDFVVESWEDGTGGWYRKYRSGWVEQGGFAPLDQDAATITFWVEFADTNYNIQLTGSGRTNTSTDTGGADYTPGSSDFTTTSFRITQAQSDRSSTCWIAIGKAATE